jgi:HEAT repeat protein
MGPIRCPYCGAANTEDAARSDGSFVCQSCGKAVEPPPAVHGVVPPPIADDIEDNRRWSDGPPEESANRWSTIAPWGDDDSTSSVSVSQSSILPRDAPEEPAEPQSDHGAAAAKPARSPLAWLLVILVLFVVLVIGAIFLAQRIRPWLDARRAAAERAKVEFWWPKLDRGAEDSSREAARAIVDLGPAAVVKTLDHISHDPGNGEAFKYVLPAIHALAAAGPDASAGLCAGLRSPEPNVRAAAASVVQEMGRAGRATRDDLMSVLTDENRWVRLTAIDALGSLDGDAAPATKSLAKLAATHDFTTQGHAVNALGHIGPAARDALPTLETVGKTDIDPITRGRAKRAAKQIDVRSLAGQARHNASGPLKPLLEDVLSEDGPAAIAAAGKLGEMGLAAEPAAAGLAMMLHHDDPARRAAAAAALGKLQLGATDFVPTLESAATDDDPRVRAAVARALEMINGKPK